MHVPVITVNLEGFCLYSKIVLQIFVALNKIFWSWIGTISCHRLSRRDLKKSLNGAMTTSVGSRSELLTTLIGQAVDLKCVFDAYLELSVGY